MKRRISLLAICIGIVFVAVLAIQHSTEAQRQGRAGGGGGPRGAFMLARSLPLDSSWAQVSFELDVSDEVLVKARKVYKEAWGKRSKLMEKAMESGEDMTADAEKIKSDLAKKLKDVLSPDQMEKLAKWESENQQRRMPGGPGGGGRQR